MSDIRQDLTGLGIPSHETPDAASTAALGLAEKPVTPLRLAWRRFRRHKLAMASAVILLGIYRVILSRRTLPRP